MQQAIRQQTVAFKAQLMSGWIQFRRELPLKTHWTKWRDM